MESPSKGYERENNLGTAAVKVYRLCNEIFKILFLVFYKVHFISR